MSNEGVGEEIVEAGLELINPGGRPDVLRAAATSWRNMGSELESAFDALDKKVQATLGEHWKGDSADAFEHHWNALKQGIQKTEPTFTQAAKGLDDAADSIEEVNDEIHAIYVEIGVSIGVGVALSFVTLGFGGAAAAANATRLAAQAARVSARLASILTRIASGFRHIAQLAKANKFLTNVAINWVGNTAGSVAGKAWSGDGVSGADLWEATWQGGVGAVAGTGPGLKMAKYVGGKFGDDASVLLREAASGAAGGATGNVVGGWATEGAKVATGEEFNREDAAWGTAANAVGGAVGGAAVAGVGRLNQPTEGLQVPEGFTPAPERSGPAMSIDAPMGGISAGLAGAGQELAQGDDEGGDRKPEAKSEPQGRSVKDTFG
ncbi:WXG100 family type VII secretion target [Streptomyces inhibens]|uniref:WXG100 family type VII secretion target n=1 Tax=Streptomyces inhibens TaxID=2293571 RepID=UPI001EE6D6F1|nr:WXG100 family type VII secretion target [Streptomyces inhibens]UKY50928.1 WXG100 family type VII secretion target [Streptomyces inhibens]